MNSELVDKLSVFGLTRRQASVYAAIIESGCTSIDQISEATGIHPQDIYKIAIRLQEEGLVTRTFSKPLIIEAFPIEIGLKRRLISEKQQAREKIAELEDRFAEIRKILSQKQKTIGKNEKTAYVYLLEGMTNATILKICLALEDVKTDYAAVLPTDPFYYQDLENVKTWTKILGKHEGVKIRVILAPKNVSNPYKTSFENKQLLDMAEAIKKTMPQTADFELKAVSGEDKAYSAILDSEEVWFFLRSGNKMSTLVSGSRELVNLAKDEFEILWNSPKAEILARTSSPLQRN